MRSKWRCPISQPGQILQLLPETLRAGPNVVHHGLGPEGELVRQSIHMGRPSVAGSRFEIAAGRADVIPLQSASYFPP